MDFRKLNIAYSTCPNDTFMFDALINGRINGEGLKFDVHLADIEELNKGVENGEPDVSKISYAVFPGISDRYQLLNSGSAVGYGNGPLVISKRKIYPDELENVTVAIPGVRTTANYLLTSLFPGISQKRTYLFSDIADAIQDNEVEAGVIIHETRFTYMEKGLRMIADLGELWEKKFGLPIPLGGIVVRRDLPVKIKYLLNDKIAESITYGFAHPSDSMPYIRQHARELSEKVIRNHIELYVNDFSLDLGEKGREAVRTLFDKGIENRLFDMKNENVFITSGL